MTIRQTLGLLLGALILSFAGCRHSTNGWPEGSKKRVLVSFPPLYCFAKSVGANDVSVHCLLSSQGPHDFSPRAEDVLLVRSADLILINGLGLDEWITKMQKGDKPKVTEIGEVIPEKQLKEMAEGSDHDGHSHAHGAHDPHVWLGPPQAKLMVAAIAEKLAEIDPSKKSSFEERANKTNRELDTMHEFGKKAFKDKKSLNIIATHDSLQYFADAFGLKVVGSIQPRAGVEADAKKITGLVQLCKEHDVRVIAIEPQYSKGGAEALKNQLSKFGVQVELVEVDPLETAPALAETGDPDPAYYMKQMYRNIDNLAKALR